MCGLVGAVKLKGNLTDKDKKAFHLMLNFDTVRGEDSTGIIFDNMSGAFMYNKGLGTPQAIEFVGQTWLSDDIKSAKSLLCGHNRHATQGAVNADNAHPFVFGNIVGAHNGTVRNTYELRIDKDFDVDSKYIFYHMDKKGFKSAMKAVNESYGAACLTWVNNEEKTFNILRNEQRPMTYCIHNDTLFYASEDWMITVAVAKAYNVSVAPQQLPVGIHLSVDLSVTERKVTLTDVAEEVKYVAPATNFRSNTSHANTGSKYIARKENVIVELVSDDGKGGMEFTIVWPLDLYGVLGKMFYATYAPDMLSTRRANLIRKSSKMWTVPMCQVVTDQEGNIKFATLVSGQPDCLFEETDLTHEQELAIIEHEQKIELEDSLWYTEDDVWELPGWSSKPVSYSAVKMFLGNHCDCGYCAEPFPTPEIGLEGWDYDRSYGCMVCPTCLEDGVLDDIKKVM